VAAASADFHFGMAAGEFGADELVSPPNVVPVFHGNKNQIGHRDRAEGAST
jgi:hypothetical protein